MPKVEHWFKQDLKDPVKVHSLNGSVFTFDNVGSVIGVEVFDSGNPVALTGTVNGYVILPDDTTISVAGTRSNNKASINLPQSALAIPGFIKIAVKLTNSSEITTLLAVVATVYKSRTDTIITPSQQIITDWSQQIAAEMQAVEDASAAQDAKIDDLKSALNFVNDAEQNVFYFGENWSGTYHSLFVRKTKNNTFYLDGTHTGSYDYRIISYDTAVSVVTAQSNLDKTKFTIDLIKGQKYKIRYEKLSGNAMTDTNSMILLYGINDQDAVFSQGVGVNPKELSDNAIIEKSFIADATKYALVLYERSLTYSGTYRICILHDIINDDATDESTDETYSVNKITNLVTGTSEALENMLENTQNNLIANYDDLVYSKKTYTITKTDISDKTYRQLIQSVQVNGGDNLVFDIVDAAVVQGTGVTAQVRFSFYGANLSNIYKDYDATVRKISYTVPEGYTLLWISYCIFGTNTEPVTATFGRVYVYKAKLLLNESLVRIQTMETLQQEVEELAEKAGTAFPIEYNDRFFVNGRFVDCINPYKEGGSLQLKGQLHCHRTNNSGTILSTLEQIYGNYAPLYDFMNLTDYNAYANLTDFDELVALNNAQSTYNLIQLTKGYELKITAGGSLTKNPHLIVLNANQILTVPAGTMPYDAIKYLVENGCIVDFAHPTYSQLDADAAKEIKRDCRFIEVVNGGSSFSETQWDAMLTQGNIVWGIGVSDAHGTGASIINTSYVKVFANEKTREAIMESLLNGNFYASNGALIDSVSVSSGGYVVNCAESATIDFIGEEGEVLQSTTGETATYHFTGAERYVRAKVTIGGQYAWTQPVIMARQIIRI